MIGNILLAFIPIFVAVDAVGALPIFVSLTEGLGQKERLKIILHSVLTALCLAIGFIFLGKAVFRFLGITIGDFMIAGGAILFCISIIDIINPVKKRRMPGRLRPVKDGPLNWREVLLLTDLAAVNSTRLPVALFSLPYPRVFLQLPLLCP